MVSVPRVKLTLTPLKTWQSTRERFVLYYSENRKNIDAAIKPSHSPRIFSSYRLKGNKLAFLCPCSTQSRGLKSLSTGVCAKRSHSCCSSYPFTAERGFSHSQKRPENSWPGVYRKKKSLLCHAMLCVCVFKDQVTFLRSLKQTGQALLASQNQPRPPAFLPSEPEIAQPSG